MNAHELQYDEISEPTAVCNPARSGDLAKTWETPGLPDRPEFCHSLKLIKRRLFFNETNSQPSPPCRGRPQLNPAHATAGMTAYLRTFLRLDPPALRRAILLNFATAITEGAGLMLLLPLLSLAGVLGNNAAAQGWLPPLDRALSLLGFKWNIASALLLFVSLVFLQSQLSLYRDRETHCLQQRFGDYLRKSLYAAISRARWSFFTNCHSGEVLSILTNEVQRIVNGTYFLLRFFTVAVLSAAYLVVALRLSVELTLLAFATGIVLWVVLRSADSTAKQSGIMLSQANRGLFAQMQEFLSAMKLIRIHGEETGNVRRFENEVEQVSSRFLEFHRVSTRVQATHRVGGAVALAVLCYSALTWFELPAANLLVMIAIFSRMLPQLAELQQGRQQLLHMLPAFASWRQLLDDCEANRDPLESRGARTPLLRQITFARVNFSHAQSHHRLDVDQLSIPARKTTAIVGASGSGKSTLLDLLSGLLSPDSGSILVDGVPLPQLPGWRSSIAYIPQETLIQNGSIRDNLLWGNSNPSDCEIEGALTQAALLEWVQRLPQGLDTEVGERGIKLSGGEKQRLALARALLRHPQLLVLDSIRSLHGSMTVLIVTHRSDELSGLIDGTVQVEQGKAGQWQAVA